MKGSSYIEVSCWDLDHHCISYEYEYEYEYVVIVMVIVIVPRNTLGCKELSHHLILHRVKISAQMRRRYNLGILYEYVVRLVD